MRRSDREVMDIAKIEEVICKCTHLRLGFCDDGEVYIVPLNFGYEKTQGERTFYFHSAAQGRKIDLISKNPRVGFELEADYALTGSGKLACEYSASYKSIIGTGELAVITDGDEKLNALRCIMKQSTGKIDWSFDSKMVESVCAFKLIVKTISCKEHL